MPLSHNRLIMSNYFFLLSIRDQRWRGWISQMRNPIYTLLNWVSAESRTRVDTPTNKSSHDAIFERNPTIFVYSHRNWQMPSLNDMYFLKNVNITIRFDKLSVCLCFGRIIVKKLCGISPVLDDLWISLEVLARNLLNLACRFKSLKAHKKK